MCGISGFMTFSDKFGEKDLYQMTKSLAHRGPDASGTWTEKNIALGHQRLSIIDPVEEANQPFFSEDKRYILVYNGEIYNYNELRNEFFACETFKTKSDTEVVLKCFEKFGVDCASYFNGMFALAIYDTQEQSLYILRDRIGIKPLYYYWDGKDFAFASEMKAIFALNIQKDINKEALKDYFFLEYIPGSQSIIQNIYKLPAGYFMKINENGLHIKQFYDLLNKFNPDYKLSSQDYIEKLNEQLTRSLQYRQVSDVPIGAFLSGGTDSSSVCAKFQEISESPVNTFSIGFDVSSFDETYYAEKVAGILNTQHKHISLHEDEAISYVEEMVSYYDEPFAVPSVLPTLLVSKKARENVTVALSGDGGDELFMGYGYYNWYSRIKKINKLGYAGTRMASKLLELGNQRHQRAARVFDIPEFENFWLHVWSQEQYMFTEKEISHLTGEKYRHKTLKENWQCVNNVAENPYDKIALFDLKNYLSQDLLYKVDTASMAYGLEVRVPMLDHNLVELAINIPHSLKIKNGEQKYILKKWLEKYLPEDLIYRKKWGFPAPMGDWLQSQLGFLIDKYLNRDKLDKHGLFNSFVIEKLVHEFRAGKKYHYKRIWALIVFQIWFEKWFGPF